MARYLGAGAVLKSPRTARVYTVTGAEAWRDQRGLRPPAHIIGVGGFGVTYRVVDDRGATFAMKEFYPRDHALRGTDGRIGPKRSEDGFSRKIYEEGLRRFVAEGHLLTSFSHPNVCRVVDAFDDSGTSYQLMPLVEGREALGESDTGTARIERRVTLEDYLRELERPESGVVIDLPLIEPVLRQLLSAVEYIHTEGTRKAQEITGAETRALLHRDIKPSNVLIEAPEELRDAPAAEVLRDPRTRVVLIDFGSARMFRDAATDDVSRSIGVVTEGYAPPELKDNQIEQQGPHSDIYSLAALIWRALLGRKPTLAQLANGAKLADLAQPAKGDDGVSHPRAPKAFLQAVDRALNAAAGQRPQSIAQWRTELFGGKVQPPKPKEDEERKTKISPLVWGGAGVAAAVAAGVFLLGDPTVRNIERQADLAYADAEKAADLAKTAADGAEAAGRDGLAIYDAGMAKAKEGSDRFNQAQTVGDERIYHDRNSGDPAYGDTYRRLNLNNGSQVTWWCHRKGSDVVPDSDYSKYDYPDFTLDGQAGWGCGIGHTHVIHHEFTEAKNPWRVTGSDYFYNGEVDPAAEHPTGLGQIVTGDHNLTGRFAVRAANYDAVGVVYRDNHPIGRGRYFLALSAPGTVDASTAEELTDGKVVFRGKSSGDRRLGQFFFPQGQVFGVEVKGGAGMGKANAEDGSVFYGAGAGKGAIWGRLETSAGVYKGQVDNLKPEGCGVWDRGGHKEAGFYAKGVKQEGKVPESCRGARYQAPFDIEALARIGEPGGDR